MTMTDTAARTTTGADPEETFEEESEFLSQTCWDTLCVEARSVTAWAFLALVLRMIASLATASSQAATRQECLGDSCANWTANLHSCLSVLLGLIVLPIPGKVPERVPGFFLSSPWLLSWIQIRFGALPSVPLRICETVLGRVTPRELAIGLPVHLVCTLSTAMSFNLLLPESIATLSTTPLEYSDTNWALSDFIREATVHAAFCVSFLVLPELLTLNKIPVWFSTFVMYPIFAFGVDAEGRGSALSPNLMYALAACDDRPVALSRMIGGCFGGFLGGKIMRVYFPDDPKPSLERQL